MISQIPKKLIVTPIGDERSLFLLYENLRVLDNYTSIYISKYASLKIKPHPAIVKIVRSYGCKLSHWKKIPQNLTNMYDYIWFLDEDIDLRPVDWNLMHKVAALRPPVFQLAILPPNNCQENLRSHNDKCRSTDIVFLRNTSDSADFRYIRRTEVQATLVDSRLWKVLHHRIQKKNKYSVWGVDTVWDQMAYYLHGQLDTLPPLILNTFVMHHNFRTMDKKSFCVRKCLDCNNLTFTEKIHLNYLYTNISQG